MSFKDLILDKPYSIGSWIQSSDSRIVELMAKSNLDWLVIDMEHSPISFQLMTTFIQIISLSNKKSFVRVGENNNLNIKQALDAGADGVIVPYIQNIEQAKLAVSYSKYPPDGMRGVGLSRAQGFGRSFTEYFANANDKTSLILQIEDFNGIENLEEILSLNEVDGLMVGPYDLSCSIGAPGDFEDARFTNYLEKFEKLVIGSNKFAGYHVVSGGHQKLESIIEKGYKFIAYGTDMVFMSEKLDLEFE